MTNNEAIEILKRGAPLNMIYDAEKVGEYHQAVELAIEALESVDKAPTAGERPQGECANCNEEEYNKMNWCGPSLEQEESQEESEQPNDETFSAICDHNDGICDPTYITDFIDCSDMGIYPWGVS